MNYFKKLRYPLLLIALLMNAGCSTVDTSCEDIREIYKSALKEFADLKSGPSRDKGVWLEWTSSYQLSDAANCRVRQWKDEKNAEYLCTWEFDYFRGGSNDKHKELVATVSACVRGGGVEVLRDRKIRITRFELSDAGNPKRVEIDVTTHFAEDRRDTHSVRLNFKTLPR
jgi:hypothetical protein